MTGKPGALIRSSPDANNALRQADDQAVGLDPHLATVWRELLPGRPSGVD
jgi:hypothetical protein